MNDVQFRDFCAASALSGLIARCEEEDDQLRHRFHLLALEAFRAADEMVVLRKSRNAPIGEDGARPR